MKCIPLHIDNDVKVYTFFIKKLIPNVLLYYCCMSLQYGQKTYKLMLRYTLTDTYTKLWGAPHQFTKTNSVL